MPERDVAAFYRDNPRMISSPFGGVEGIDADLLRWALKEVAFSVAGKSVLDIGCGRGFAREVVEGDGGHYTGLDFVRSATGFQLAIGDACMLPFAESSFDAAICLDAFEHFPDPDAAACEIRRVLRPGGEFFLSAPNYSNVAGLVKRAYEFIGWYERDTWAPFGRWQPQELETRLTVDLVRETFRSAGFNKIWYRGHPREVGLGLFPWVDHPKTPDAVRFRLQRLFNALGPAFVRAWPASSLHCFWKMH